MPMPDRIDDAELAYLQRVFAAYGEAKAALEHYTRHLMERYQCGPQDALRPDGTIHRAAPPASEPDTAA